jgi:hypothetical protein
MSKSEKVVLAVGFTFATVFTGIIITILLLLRMLHGTGQ